MESFRLVFRKGYAHQYTTEQLRKLLRALEDDDARLLQGATTTPPPLQVVSDWPVEAADPVTFPCVEWGETTVGEAEEFFAKVCFHADQQLGEPAACRWLLNYIDDTPRDEMRRELAAEVRRELCRRGDTAVELDPALMEAWNAAPDETLRCAIIDWLLDRGDLTGAEQWKTR